jgi:hypothetical protein
VRHGCGGTDFDIEYENLFHYLSRMNTPPAPSTRFRAARYAALPATLLFAALAATTAGVTRACEAASDDDSSEASAPAPGQRFTLSGYATVNYFAFDWDTDPTRRNQIDLERLALYPACRLDDHAWLRGEIELEHGGTGASVEFDRFEELGEFEDEIEKGGEVVLEQLHLDWTWRPALGVKLGRFKLPVGLASQLDEPSEYFTTTVSETESSLIPVNWYETGIQIHGDVGAPRRVSYAVSLVNGLDSSGFSSANWIARGYQTRFETVNAQNLAVTARLDVHLEPETFCGVCIYTGNTADNRPQADLHVPARVVVGDAHAALHAGALRARAVFLDGSLQNADQVSQANRNLSNNLNVKRTPVGSEAIGWSVEAGYDLSSWLRALHPRLDLFARYEHYDSMAGVTGTVFDNPRWERTVTTVGANLQPCHGVVLKAQYSHRRLGIPTDNDEHTVSIGTGFEF